MYRKQLSCALLSLGSVAAHAQSNITLYGTLDNGVTAVSNVGGSSTIYQQSGVMNKSRWGLTGQEDLGAGTAAVFKLENRFNVTNGAISPGGVLQPGGQLFSGQAYVGLSSPYGTLTLGRQYTFNLDYVATVGSSGMYNTGHALHISDLDGLGGEEGDSSVKYVTPVMHGLTMGAMYAFGDQGATSHTGRTLSVGAHYEQGGFSAAAVYTATYNQSIAFLTPHYGISSLFGQAVTTSAVNVDRTQAVAAAVAYKWQQFGLNGMVTGTNVKVGSNSGNLMTYEISGHYYINPAFVLSAGYTYETFSGQKYGQTAATAAYFLSKRTEVYLTALNMHSYSGAQAYILGTPGASSTDMQSLIRLGMVHRF